MPIDGGSKQERDETTAAVRSAAPDAIVDAALLLRAGRLVAMPTETVYGLAADATNSLAVARIFEAKGRPRFNPLIVHVADVAEAKKLGVFSAKALQLARAFWPGPLTLVVPRVENCPVSELASAGLATLALRVPANPVARELLTACKRPLAAPSANRSGHVSATTAAHVADDLGARVALILDGGPARLGIESTVVDATGDRIAILRPGSLSRAEIELILGDTVEHGATTADRPSAPGQLDSHYAPHARLRLDAEEVCAGEALLAFGPYPLRASGPQANLSPSGDLVEAAANLFAQLRALDATGATAIAVMPIPETGLGEAINDRLRRAAAPRPPAQNGTSPR